VSGQDVEADAGAGVEGVLVGGNLTMLASAAGTAFVHAATDSIALLEDVGERPYRLDRALTQLIRSGWFVGVRGVVCGQFTDCGDPSVISNLLLARLAPLGVPLLFDATFGHGQPNVALPLGAIARLDLATSALTVEPVSSTA
jgi:muramoyltetrapeptide carboxypeptidase